MGNKNHETYGSLGAYALKAAGGTKTHKVYGNVEFFTKGCRGDKKSEIYGNLELYAHERLQGEQRP
jgi:hypothetical protein